MQLEQKPDYLYSVLVPQKNPFGMIKQFICYILLTMMIVAASGGLYYAAYYYAATNPNIQTIDTPYYDTNSYKAVTLSNRLQALLVSNPNTASASVALQIGIGSFSDPVDKDGVANLCQHLVLLGSKNYPDQEFLKYLANQTGFQESTTDLEKTTFSFQLEPSALEKALIMFSDIFLQPAFTSEDIKKAAASISGDMEKNYGSTNWRVHGLLQLLSAHNHTFARFSSGNNETLSTISKDQVTELFDAAKKFYENYYSSNIMSLVISSNQDLDTLENWTRTSFKEIVDKAVLIPSFNGQGDPFKNKETYTEFLPVGGENEIYLFFYTMPLDKYYPEKPFEYVRNLLEDKGEGSLSEYLADMSYAQGVKVSVETNSSFGSIVQVKATLSYEALAYPDLFLIAFFSYIDLIKSKGVTQQIWDDIAKEASLNFNYTRVLYSKPIRYAQKLVTNLAKYKFKDSITGDLLFKNYDPNLIQSFLNSFSIKNCVVLISSPLYNRTQNATIKTDSSSFFELSLERGLVSQEERKTIFKNKGGNKLHKSALTTRGNSKKDTTNQTVFIPNNSSENFTEASYIFLKNKELEEYNATYRVAYTTQKMPYAFSSMINNLTYSSIPQFSLPSTNQYFPKTLQMYCNLQSTEACNAEFEKDAQVYWPSDVSSYLDYGHTWYQMDRSFRSPRVIIDLIFHSPIVYKTPRLQFEFLLFCSYLQSILQPKLSLQAHVDTL